MGLGIVHFYRLIPRWRAHRHQGITCFKKFAAFDTAHTLSRQSGEAEAEAEVGGGRLRGDASPLHFAGKRKTNRIARY
jgi:hypothetical protein